MATKKAAKKSTAKVAPKVAPKVAVKAPKTEIPFYHAELVTFLQDLGACDGEAIQWASTQPGLKAAWKNCTRTDWMMWLLNRMRRSDVLLDQMECKTMRFELNWMDQQFGERWKSRKGKNTESRPSSIGSRHLYEWTDEERKEMCDFIRFYFPIPQYQERANG